MLVVEQSFAHDSHSHIEENESTLICKADGTSHAHVEFDTELGDLHGVEPSARQIDVLLDSTRRNGASESNGQAFGLLLGLVVHGIADGLALGVSNVPRNETGSPRPISYVVFLALILHKGNLSIKI